jgi:hypothetical protein
MELEHSPKVLWEIFGEGFENVSDWASLIIKSSLDGDLGEGAVRTCDLKQTGPVAAGKVTEEITHFDRQELALTYVVRSGIPGMMRHLDNAWTFADLGGGRTRVTSTLNLKMAWWSLPMLPLIRMQLKKTIRSFIAQLDRYAAQTSSARSASSAA